MKTYCRYRLDDITTARFLFKYPQPEAHCDCPLVGIIFSVTSGSPACHFRNFWNWHAPRRTRGTNFGLPKKLRIFPAFLLPACRCVAGGHSN